MLVYDSLNDCSPIPVPKATLSHVVLLKPSKRYGVVILPFLVLLLLDDFCDFVREFLPHAYMAFFYPSNFPNLSSVFLGHTLEVNYIIGNFEPVLILLN